MKHGGGIEYYKQNIVFVIAKYYKDEPEGRIVIIYNNKGKLIYNGGLINGKDSWYGSVYSDDENNFLLQRGNFYRGELNGHDCEIYFETDGSKNYKGDMVAG